MTYIDPRGKVFAHVDRLVRWQLGERPAPVTVEWDLSNRCTLGCVDCHFAHTHVRGPWVLRPTGKPVGYAGTGDLADVPTVRAALTEMAAAGVRGVVWSGGGEPTTHPSWREIVAHAGAQGLQQGMYTHGGLLTREHARWLAARAAWVVVSLDAVNRDVYAADKGVNPQRFDAACNGLEWLSGWEAVIGASFLLTAHNWQQAQEMVALSKRLGATYATFRPAIRTSPSSANYCVDDRSWVTAAMPMLESLANEAQVEIDPARFAAYRDWTGHGYTACQGIRLNATVTPDGRVWVCPQRRGVEGSCLGDLSVESFSDLWSRHPGFFAVDEGCRVMCRLHPVNETLAALGRPKVHEAFV